jgi:hypothetical protein
MSDSHSNVLPRAGRRIVRSTALEYARLARGLVLAAAMREAIAQGLGAMSTEELAAIADRALARAAQ